LKWTRPLAFLKKKKMTKEFRYFSYLKLDSVTLWVQAEGTGRVQMNTKMNLIPKIQAKKQGTGAKHRETSNR